MHKEKPFVDGKYITRPTHQSLLIAVPPSESFTTNNPKTRLQNNFATMSSTTTQAPAVNQQAVAPTQLVNGLSYNVYCSKCGKAIRNGSRCSGCGTKN